MLEDLIKALGLGPTLPVATGIPDGKEAAMSSVPVVREIPQATSQGDIPPPYVDNPQVSPNVRGLYGDITMPDPSTESIPYRMGQMIGNPVEGGVDSLIPIAEPVRNILDRARDVIGFGADATFEDLKAGYTGEESKADWDNTDPGSSSQKEYLDGLLAKQSAISEKVFEAPGVKEIVSAADAVKPEAISGLTPEQQALVDEKARIAAELLANDEDTDPKTVMQMAGDALGSLFDDDAIKQALIYYTGARLMGYSASGSGMAAGNLLQKGWAAQNKNATDQAEADRKTDLAALKARTPDRSKTVQMFDTDSKKIIEVNMAPNGDAYPPGSEKGFNAASAGLVTYRPATHKTFNDIDNDMVTYTNKAMTDALASLKDEEIYPNAEYTKGLFEDGLAVSQLVQHATRRLKDSGVDYDTPAFRNALSNTIKSEVLKVARGGEAVDNETMTKDLIGTVESNWLKASLEGAVPKFVLGKYTQWGDDGKGVTYDKDFELPREDQTRLFDTASSINRQFLDYYTEKNPKNKAKIRKTITQTNTISNLSKVFTTNVMSDKKAATHWQQVADKSNPPTNAFSAWLQSEKSDTAMHPLNYKGLNNPSVKSKAEDMYESQLKD